MVATVVEDEGFRINQDKTRVLRKHQRQVVTGIIVNDGLNVNRKYIKNTKAMLHKSLVRGISSQLYFDRSGTVEILVCHFTDLVVFIAIEQGLWSVMRPKKIYESPRGRLNFMQVATANQGLDKNNFGKRIGVYERLEIMYNKIVEKEKFTGGIQRRAMARLAKLQNNTLINDIEKMSIEKLDLVVDSKSKDDPRFFTYDFKNLPIDKYRKRIQEFFKYPIDNRKVRVLLNSLKMSDSTLMKITHKEEVTFDDIKELIENYTTNQKYHLPKGIRELFDGFFDEIQVVGFRQQKKSINIIENPALLKSMLRLKRSTRFGKNPEDSTDLAAEIKSISEKVLYKKMGKELSIEFKLEALSFYTDVKSFLYALESIIASMYRHTPDEKGNFIKVKSYYHDNNETIFTISNNDKTVLDKEYLNRSLLANGKTRKAIFYLNGLCDYSVSANFEGYGWKKINMLKGDDIKDCEARSGYTHTLRFKI